MNGTIKNKGEWAMKHKQLNFSRQCSTYLKTQNAFLEFICFFPPSDQEIVLQKKKKNLFHSLHPL